MNHTSLDTWIRSLPPSERQALAVLWNVAVDQLANTLHDPAVIVRRMEHLPAAAQAALERVCRADGRITASQLEREFGGVRPHAGMIAPRAYLLALQGIPSPVEMLFTLGLLQRVQTTTGIDYTIFEEWLAVLGPLAAPVIQSLEPLPEPPATVYSASPERLEYDLVALLALAYAAPLRLNAQGSFQRSALIRLAERLQIQGAIPSSDARWPEAALLRGVAVGCELLIERQGALRVAPKVLDWLGLSPIERLEGLVRAWIDAPNDDFVTLVGLRWRTPPLERPSRVARLAFLDIVATLPDGWLALDALINHLQHFHPDFCRPNGDLGAWHLATADGKPLDGWGHWLAIDGALARAWLTGPLHWLGLIDLSGVNQPTHVRLNQWGRALLGDAPPPEVPAVALQVAADGRVEAPSGVSPLALFQLQRIAAWQPSAVDTAWFRLTSQTLEQAFDHGISLDQMVEFLHRWAEPAPPQALLEQLKAWEQRRHQLVARSKVVFEFYDSTLPTELAAAALDLPPYQTLRPDVWAFEPADASQAIACLRDHGYGLTSAAEIIDAPLTERDLVALLVAAQVVAALSRQARFESGISAALLERVRRLLPSTARATAIQQARSMSHSLGIEEEFDA